jgi:hypothetical protein
MSLVHELVKELLDDKPVTAIYGGGFKPPTAGHFLVVQDTLKKFPEIDNFIIYVGGGKPRDGVSQDESLLVWDIYKKYLPSNVEIQPSKAPIGDIKRYAKAHPDEIIYYVLGQREGKDEDATDIAIRTKDVDKYPNIRVKIIKTSDAGISGTASRKALKVSQEEFTKFLPAKLSAEDKTEVYNIVSPVVKETLNENATYSKDIDIIEKCAALTNYMRDKGYTIDPLPAVEFINGDSENARDFFGKTAYYDPNNQTIVLYTEGRHPKDIVRSYAHEMIHHIQNLEGRLGPITTQNTQEDDHLNDIEAEANLKGTMTFRNWTDSLNEIGDASAAKLEWRPSRIDVIAREIERKIRRQDEDTVEYYDMLPAIEVVSYESRTRYRVTVDASVDKPEDGLAMTTLRVDFTTEEGGDDAINKGEQYKILATLTDIIIQLINRVNEIDSTTLDLVKFYAKDDTEGKYANPDSKRGKLYQAFINKNLSKLPGNWKMSTSDEVIMLSPVVNESKKLNDPFGLLEDILYEGAYDSLVTQLTKATINKWVEDSKKKPMPKKSFVDIDIDDVDGKGREIEFNYVGLVEFDKKVDGYEVDGTSNSGEDEGKMPFVATLFRINPKVLPQAWSKISADVSDVIRHEIEHLTQAGDNVRGQQYDEKGNLVDKGKYMDDDIILRDLINKAKVLPQSDYYKLEKEVDAMLQGLYLKAKKTKKPFKDVIKNYLSVAPGIETKEDREIILNLWRSRRGALSLPVFETRYKLGKVMNEQETEEQQYTIYCDMDGVLTDFDKQFEALSNGISPTEYKNREGNEGFWELIDGGGVGFWVGMPWMPNGKQLWEYIAKYNPIILSAPSKQNESRLGKRLWVRNNIKPKPKLILASAYSKPNYSKRNKILIDDRPDTIDAWNAKGGIGILFKSTSQVIQKLQELGL